MTEPPERALERANAMMIEALAILDAVRHPAAAYLDQAIVRLALRPPGDGIPAEHADHWISGN